MSSSEKHLVSMPKPEISLPILGNCSNKIRWQAVLGGIVFKRPTIELAQPILCAKPKMSLVILVNCGDIIARQSILGCKGMETLTIVFANP